MGSVLTIDANPSIFREPDESPFQLERHASQWRQMDKNGIWATHPFPSFAVDAAKISYIAAAVGFGIGIDDLAVETGFRDA